MRLWHNITSDRVAVRIRGTVDRAIKNMDDLGTSVCKQVEAECQWKPRASGHVAVRTCDKAKKITLIYNINTEHGYWQEDRRVGNSSQHLKPMRA